MIFLQGLTGLWTIWPNCRMKLISQLRKWLRHSRIMNGKNMH